MKAACCDTTVWALSTQQLHISNVLIFYNYKAQVKCMKQNKTSTKCLVVTMNTDLHLHSLCTQTSCYKMRSKEDDNKCIGLHKEHKHNPIRCSINPGSLTVTPFLTCLLVISTLCTFTAKTHHGEGDMLRSQHV